MRAAGAVRVGDPWPQAQHTLHTQLGPPTKADVDAYLWAARVGDDCYLIEVRVADGRVAYVDDPYQSPARAAAGSYDRCADAAP
ncbi:MAG: hypothetical protein D6689_07690 [Deltaproteobacteria bacterium]|nr:MAG: hypothetical protein D6689_07690 [Deltaproteobacteria bacterium]